MERDIEKLAYLLNEHRELKSGYRFENEQLYRLNEIESQIKEIISRYGNNIPALAHIVTTLPALDSFIPEDLREQVEDELFKKSLQPQDKYYSYDGKAFDTIEEAIARNNVITMGNEPSKSPKSFR